MIHARVFGMFCGALVVGFSIAALFFAKFYVRTRDRLFAFFTVAFLLLASERLVSVVCSSRVQEPPWLYVVRLAAFVVIVWGIWDKNLTHTTVSPRDVG